MQNYYIDRLSNGLRVLYNHDENSVVTHCALMILSGARDETEGKEGLAHFIEHTVFKGTKKRKAFHILNHLEIVGGEFARAHWDCCICRKRGGFPPESTPDCDSSATRKTQLCA